VERDFIYGDRFASTFNEPVIYCETHKANELLSNPPKYDFVLVTHNSDGKILDFTKETRWDSADFNKIPTNLVKWFGQNVGVKNDKIFSIPIGLENPKWFVNDKKIQNIEMFSKTENKYKNLLYLNFDVSTNPKERTEPINLFSNKKWVKITNGKNGKNFLEYIMDIKTHKFVLCPEGNGIDTHRTWETLYLGSIPIEKRNVNNSFYSDLPICFVDSWDEITEEFLYFEYERIKKTKWNMDKLKFSYWKELILNSI